MNLTEWGKSVKVAPNECKFASTWLWSSFSNLRRAYKIIVEIHTQQNSPHGFTVHDSPRQDNSVLDFLNKNIAKISDLIAKLTFDINTEIETKHDQQHVPLLYNFSPAFPLPTNSDAAL